jgi:hypothetical protein
MNKWVGVDRTTIRIHAKMEMRRSKPCISGIAYKSEGIANADFISFRYQLFVEMRVI